MKRVEVLLATYQGSRYIRQLLDSLEAQSESGWTAVMSDDGSTDGTLEILREYEERFPELITVRVNDGPRGAKENFGSLMRGSDSADYLFFADQDDLWHREKLARMLHEIRTLEVKHGTGTPILVHSDLRLIDEKGREIHPSMNAAQRLEAGVRRDLRHLLVQNNVTGCAMVINKSLRDLSLPLPGEAIMHDWWLALVAAAFGVVRFIPEQLVGYRQHGGNVIGAKPLSLDLVMERLSAREKIRESLVATFGQAAAFVERYGDELSGFQRGVATAYATLGECGFLERRRRLITYGLWKAGTARNLGMLLYV